MSDEQRNSSGTPGGQSAPDQPSSARPSSVRLPSDDRDWTPAKLSVTDKLGLTKFKPDAESHLSIKNKETCRETCRRKYCTHTCPAQVYRWEEEEESISIAYEGCLECGTCRSGGCPYDNIEMSYPRGGFGVQYRFG